MSEVGRRKREVGRRGGDPLGPAGSSGGGVVGRGMGCSLEAPPGTRRVGVEGGLDGGQRGCHG